MTKAKFCEKWQDNLEYIFRDRDVFVEDYQIFLDTKKVANMKRMKDIFAKRLKYYKTKLASDLMNLPSGIKFVCDSDIQQTFEANASRRIEFKGRVYKVGDVLEDIIEDGPGPIGSTKVQIVGFQVGTNNLIVRFINIPRELYGIMGYDRTEQNWRII